MLNLEKKQWFVHGLASHESVYSHFTVHQYIVINIEYWILNNELYMHYTKGGAYILM